tara:strand:+ start:379 stop:612 length:234 start_codon:yes stop_codon:yes gene_type:complete
MTKEQYKELIEDLIEENDKLKTELSKLKNDDVVKNPNQLELFSDDAETYIYESPDGGKTVYRRKFGDHSGNKEKMNK